MLGIIITQLNLIEDALEKNQKTFIASSVLIAIDLQHPETEQEVELSRRFRNQEDLERYLSKIISKNDSKNNSKES